MICCNVYRKYTYYILPKDYEKLISDLKDKIGDIVVERTLLKERVRDLEYELDQRVLI